MSGTNFTLTPNLGLYKPIPQSDLGAWGGHLNANADKLDTVLSTGTGGAFLPLSGGTVAFLNISGQLVLANIPTSAAGLTPGSGVVYSNGGVLCIA